jgi:hypothetical protein
MIRRYEDFTSVSANVYPVLGVCANVHTKCIAGVSEMLSVLVLKAE